MTPRQDSRPAHDEAGVVAPSRVMLVAIVLVAVAAVTYIAGLGSGSDDATDTASTAAARSAASSAPADPSTSASASAGASASPSATSSPSAKASRKATPSPTAASSAAPAVQRAQVRVSVFNNSSTTGLGARTSDKVKGAGWKVLGTDNWYGTIPEPTVYYPASLQAAAKVLAKDVGIDRVKPAVAPMRSDRLTLIVTADYRA